MGTLAPLFFIELILTIAVLAGSIITLPNADEVNGESTVSDTSKNRKRLLKGKKKTENSVHDENSDTDSEKSSDEASEAPKDKKKGFLWYYNVFSTTFITFAVLMGLFDFVGIVNFGNYMDTFALMGAFLLLNLLCRAVYRKNPGKTVKFFAKALIAVLVIELTVFQFPSYRMLFGKYTEVFVPFENMGAEASDYDPEADTITIHGKGTAKVWYDTLNERVATVKLNIVSTEKGSRGLKINASMNDDTNSDLRQNILKWNYAVNNYGSEYTAAYLSGKTEKVEFTVNGVSDRENITVSGFTFNEPIPFDVSPLRVFLMLFLSTLCYAIVYSSYMNTEWVKHRAVCCCFSIVLAMLSIALSIGIVMVKTPDSFKKHFKFETGNQITEELVLAFENKQVSLLDEPSEQLMSLDDPYDWSLRSRTEGLSAKWDHVYYNGKYYSYYGIAPVILFFLPFHKITGYIAPTDFSVCLFAIVGFIFLTMTYTAIMKRWFRHISAGFYIAGNIILITVCGVWYSVGRTLFYEISISSGFMFIAMGAFFLISSNVISEGKTSLVKVFFASLFFGLAVLCRPTLAVYSICACVYYLIGFKKSGIVTDKEGNSKEIKVRRIIYAVCALLPLGVLAGVQMWYNNARFDSPLDFGIQYSLTINDFVDSEYHTIFVLIGTFAYLFGFPNFRFEYPFVDTYFSYLCGNGYYFKDAGTVSGIFFLALPVWSYLYSHKALKALPDRKTRLQTAVIIGLPCVLMPLVILFSIWESGYAVRYVADFSWQILIGAYAIFFFLYQKCGDMTKRRLMRKFMAFSVIAALAVNVAHIVSFTFGEDFPNVTVGFSELIEFWR